MSSNLERRTNDHLESGGQYVGTRDLAPTYREEEQIIKKRVIAQRLLDEQRQLVEKGVAVVSDNRYDAKIAHRVATDRTYRLLSDIEDEVQFKEDAEFYGKADRGLDDTLLTICKVTEDAVVGTIQSHKLPQDALLIRQEEEKKERVLEEVVEDIPVSFRHWWNGSIRHSYYR